MTISLDILQAKLPQGCLPSKVSCLGKKNPASNKDIYVEFVATNANFLFGRQCQVIELKSKISKDLIVAQEGFTAPFVIFHETCEIDEETKELLKSVWSVKEVFDLRVDKQCNVTTVREAIQAHRAKGPADYYEKVTLVGTGEPKIKAKVTFRPECFKDLLGKLASPIFEKVTSYEIGLDFADTRKEDFEPFLAFIKDSQGKTIDHTGCTFTDDQKALLLS